MSEVQGVVMVYIDPKGRVIASASDFDRQNHSGCTLEDAQAMRAEKTLKSKVIKAYSAAALSGAMSSYVIDRMFDDLMKSGGKIETISIGHP